MFGKNFHRRRKRTELFFKDSVPSLLVVVSGGVVRVNRARCKGNLRQLHLPHRIKKYRRHFTGRKFFNRAESQFDIAVAVGRQRVIVYGVIPPNADFAPENFIYLRQFSVGYPVADNAATAVQNDNARIEIFGKIFCVRFNLVALNHVQIKIFRRNHNQPRHVLVTLAQILLHTI